MTKIAISPNVSGTGTFTLTAPDSNTDRTLTLPDEAGTVLSSVSNIEAQVKTATNATGTAPIYACRAWVNFNGTGTVAIRASGNVSSVTRTGTGAYTVNFTTAMQDGLYCANATCVYRGSGGFENANTRDLFTTSVRIGVNDTGTGAQVDAPGVLVSIFR